MSGKPRVPGANPAGCRPSVAAVGGSASVVRATSRVAGGLPSGPPPKPMTTIANISQNTVIGIPNGYGYVVLTAIGSVFLVTWKAIKVGQARQEHKVPYPAMYSLDNVAFNCIQRAHQNTLENYPQFLALLLIGGLEMPYFCTLGGMIWICGRIAYAQGYYTGDPRKRARGTFGIGGMLMLLAASTKFAVRHLW